MPTEIIFQKHLRTALNHLYNRDFLRDTPLLGDLGLAGSPDAPLVLYRTICAAIEALKPDEREPLHTDKRRIYDILVYRYIEQFKQEEVAHHIGVSLRQFKREQERAIEALVYYLWEKHGLDQTESTSSPAAAGSEGNLITAESKLSKEWDWLNRSRAEWVTAPLQLTEETLRLMQPLIDQYRVQLSISMQQYLPELTVHPVAFRQIILNLVRKAIDKAAGGTLSLQASVEGPYTVFRITARPSMHEEQPRQPTSHEENNLIMIAESLVNASGGQLAIVDSADELCVRLALPVVDGIPVLVVDDNPEITELLVRYTTGTRYRVIGMADPEQALQAAVDMGAKIIVLDVMMPKIDGWELLGRFRSHPRTASIPVIIQTILTQKDLALSLGAKALILKPIKQEAFLAALDQVVAEIHSG